MTGTPERVKRAANTLRNLDAAMTETPNVEVHEVTDEAEMIGLAINNLERALGDPEHTSEYVETARIWLRTL